MILLSELFGFNQGRDGDCKLVTGKQQKHCFLQLFLVGLSQLNSTVNYNIPNGYFFFQPWSGLQAQALLCGVKL